MKRLDRRKFLSASAGLGAMLAAGHWFTRTPPEGRAPAGRAHASAATNGEPLVRRQAFALGTTVSLAVLHDDAELAERSIGAALAEIETVESVMSIYRDSSELSRLNRDGAVHQPHRYLVDVLRTALDVSRRTDGAFDVTVQPLWSVHRAAHDHDRVPLDDELARALDLVDWRSIELRDDAIRLTQPGSAVTLNGIAQGFAVDRALAALRSHGIQHALVDVGELAAIGRKQDQSPWKVGVQHPREPEAYAALVELEHRSLATSGDYATTFTPDRASHHVFDPRTGRSPLELASVTIAAPNAMLADAWSTACLVLGPERSLERLSRESALDGLFVLKDGRTIATPGFPFAAHPSIAPSSERLS